MKTMETQTETAPKQRRRKPPATETKTRKKRKTNGSSDAVKQAKQKEQSARQAAKAAEKEAAKAAKEAEKEAFKQATLQALAKDAREINARYAAVERALDRADDQRLSAACHIAHAKLLCKEARINFKEWCEEHLQLPPKEEGGAPRKLSYESVRKLLPIGVAEEESKGAGMKMLEDMREANREANRRARDRKKEEKKTEAPKPEKVKEALGKMSKQDRADVVKEVAQEHKIDVEEPAGKVSMRERAETAFNRLRAKGKMDFAKWVCEQVGGQLVMDE